MGIWARVLVAPRAGCVTWGKSLTSLHPSALIFKIRLYRTLLQLWSSEVAILLGIPESDCNDIRAAAWPASLEWPHSSSLGERH